jgi:hypothetical protein
MPTNSLEAVVARQRAELKRLLEEPLRRAARACAEVWGDQEQLDEVLGRMLATVLYCRFVYALDTGGRQVSDNVGRRGIVKTDFGRDRSDRPYMREITPDTDFLLSRAYITLRDRRPGLTAIHTVRDKSGNALGFVGADFFLQDLPLTRRSSDEPTQWRQLRGDPAIRGAVFYQTRSESEMDRNIDTVLGVVEELMVDHGMHHIMLHFSSSRAVYWTVDDPFRYHLLDIKTLTNPDICLAFRKQPYPGNAVVPKERIRAVLDGLRALRFVDEMFYLRTGTLNIFNGIVALTFSCDGSHYMPYDEFLKMDVAFWLGSV